MNHGMHFGTEHIERTQVSRRFLRATGVLRVSSFEASA